MIRAIARVALAVLWIAAICGLIALGTWQVERRAWKLALIARVDAGLKAAPIAAPPKAGPDDSYRRVVATGRYLGGKDSFVQASTERGPGWWVLTPLVVERIRPSRRPPTGTFPGGGRGPVAQQNETDAAGSNKNLRDWAPASAGEGPSREASARMPQTILINRGYVAERRAASPPSSPVTVTGLIRLSEPRGGFLRSNDPAADHWYSRDVAAIATRRGLRGVTGYFIDADSARNAPGQPVGGLTVIRFANNHLVYALTWYVLALMTAAAFAYWIMLGRRARRAA